MFLNNLFFLRFYSLGCVPGDGYPALEGWAISHCLQYHWLPSMLGPSLRLDRSSAGSSQRLCRWGPGSARAHCDRLWLFSWTWDEIPGDQEHHCHSYLPSCTHVRHQQYLVELTTGTGEDPAISSQPHSCLFQKLQLCVKRAVSSQTNRGIWTCIMTCICGVLFISSRRLRSGCVLSFCVLWSIHSLKLKWCLSLW